MWRIINISSKLFQLIKGVDCVLLKMTLQSEKPSFRLPIHYNYLIQAALYDLLDPDFAQFLHDRGYRHGKRSFRLFTFSQLQGKYRILKETKQIRFFGQVSLSVHSPLAPFCQSVMNAIVREDGIRIGQAHLNVVHIECEEPQVTDKTIYVKTLSPVTVYSTMYRPDGRKFTHYFQPRDPDFAELIQKNLLKKFDLVYQTVPTSVRFDIEPIGKSRERVMLYKGIVIKGHTGTFKLSADDKRLLSLALDAGIGIKGSQGFGCIECLRPLKGGEMSHAR